MPLTLTSIFSTFSYFPSMAESSPLLQHTTLFWIFISINNKDNNVINILVVKLINF